MANSKPMQRLKGPVNPDKLLRHELWTTQNYKPMKSDLDRLAGTLVFEQNS